MHARISGSESTSSHAASIPRSIAPDNAFRASGRFIVTTRTWPRLSVTSCCSSGVFSGTVYLLQGHVEVMDITQFAAGNDNTF